MSGAAGLRRLLAPLVFPPRRLRLLALLLSVSLVFALFYLGSRPISTGLFSAPWDKLVHYLFFGGLCGIFWVLCGGGRPHADWGAVVLTAAVGIADEWTQAYNPGRYSSAADFAADLLGALTAVLVLAWLRRRLRADATPPLNAAPRPQTS